jgi:hypothetical protein
MNPYGTSEWTDVDTSSLITGLGIIEDDLVVRFKNGDAYLYPGLASDYKALLEASSAGGYFHQWVRKQRCQKLPRE